MSRLNIPEILRKYNLNEVELNCILLYIGSENKTYSWSQTIGIQSKSPNKTILAGQWFKNPNVDKCIWDLQNKDSGIIERTFDGNTKEQKGNTQKKEINISEDDGINAENIKALLESEFNKTKDPEKRTTLLIKIADFLSLNKTNDEDFQTPIIYLPARCKDCTYKR
jgi:hypothetical protein